MLIGSERDAALTVARSKVDMDFATAQIYGWIKIKDEESDPMPEDVKIKLRALNDQRREDKKAKEKRLKSIPTIKTPVYVDKIRQKELKSKYPWAAVFKPDPEKNGGTLVDIRCTKCAGTRTVHLGDLWQCKLCRKCKDGNNSRK